MTLEPDGAATGCNPVEVGSTPTGVSDCPTACRDYIQIASLAAEEAHLDDPSLGFFSTADR